MNAPQITVADLKALAASPAEEPVLYVDTESGRLDVWAAAYVSHHHQVLTLEEMTDAIGSEPDWDDVGDLLEEVQEQIDEVAAEL